MNTASPTLHAPQTAPGEPVSPSSEHADPSTLTRHETPAPGAIWHASDQLQEDDFYVWPEYSEALIIANDIIREVKNALPYGSANQKWNYGDDYDMPSPGHGAHMRLTYHYNYSYRRLQEQMRRYADRAGEARRHAWIQRNVAQYANGFTGRDDAHALANSFKLALEAALDTAPNATDSTESTSPEVDSALDALKKELWESKPRLRAHAALAVEAGNCDQMAALSYMLARQRFSPEYTVELVSMPGHTFCRVTRSHWPLNCRIVIDPWPRHAYALLGLHHFSHGHDIAVQRSKAGKGSDPSAEQNARYGRVRDTVLRSLDDFKRNTWPGLLTERWSVMHNALYPTAPGTSVKWRYPAYPAARTPAQSPSPAGDVSNEPPQMPSHSVLEALPELEDRMRPEGEDDGLGPLQPPG